MPGPMTAYIDRTTDPKEFEKMCRDVLSKKYEKEGYEFELYGRNGQYQQGIDIRSKHQTKLGKYLVAQCKNYLEEKTIKKLKRPIMDDLDSISNLEFDGKKVQIDTAIIMTALRHDTGLQDFVANQDADYDFDVEIMFWDDIEEILALNPDIRQKYYPGLEVNDNQEKANGHASVYRKAWNEPLFLERDGEGQKLLSDMHQLPGYQVPQYPQRGSGGRQAEEERELTYSEERADLKKVISDTIAKKTLRLIFGLPGIGKSTLYTWILNQRRINGTAIDADKCFVIRFIDLEEAVWKTDDENEIYKKLLEMIEKETGGIDGKIILLDGFDEVHCSDDVRGKLLLKLKSRIKNHAACFVTCRQNYIQNLDSIRDISWLRLCPFTTKQIKTYIGRYCQSNISESLEELLLDEDNRDVFGLPVVLYMTLAVLANSTQEGFKEEVKKYDVYDRIFRLEDGSIYDRMKIDNDTNWHISREDVPVMIDAEKLHRASEELAVWMFLHGEESCPRTQAEQIMKRCELTRMEQLGGGFFELKYLEGANKSTVWKEVRFVHKSIYEYFTAKAIIQTVERLGSDAEKSSNDPFRYRLGWLLHSRNIAEEREISEYLEERISADRLVPLTRCFEKMLVESAIDVMSEESRWIREEEDYKILSVIDLEEMEEECFRNMLYLLQIARRKNGPDARVPLRTNDDKVRTGLERHLRKSISKENRGRYDFRYFHLSNCCFDDMNLSQFNFKGADLDGCTFRGASLGGTQIVISPKDWRSERFAGANLLIRNRKTDRIMAAENVKLKPGNLISFGHYPYTKEEKENGKWSSITWRVLDVKDGAALLLSEHVLEARRYHEEWKDITWAESSLCKWLNNEFWDKAFSDEEKQQIISRTVKAEQNPHSKYQSTPAGNDIPEGDILSKVFLLNIQEVCRYFGAAGFELGEEEGYWYKLGGEQAKGYPTPYAIKNGVYVDEEAGGACWWWLRSPGDCGDSAAFVDCDGGVDCDGIDVNYDYVGIRPALWVKTATSEI